MALAAALLLPLALRAGWRALTRSEWLQLAMIGALNIFLSYSLMFSAQKHIASGLAAVLFATFPIWVAVYAHALLPAERLTPARALSALLGLGGVVVLQLPALCGASVGRGQWVPMLLGTAAPAVAGFSNVWMKKRLTQVPASVSLCAQTAVGAALLLLVSYSFEPGATHWTARGMLAISYLAVIGTVLTFLLLFWLIPRVPMSVIGAIPLFDTTVAITLGTLVAGERFSWHLGAGAALILCGTGIANLVPAATAATRTHDHPEREGADHPERSPEGA